MNLQQLRYVIAVAESGSMSGAARATFISQSALSTAVKELEEELGIKVFDRSSRGISLTEDGRDLLAYARQMVEQADLLESHFRDTRDRAAERLSVSSQHYGFAVTAFVALVSERDGSGGQFTLRETRTAEVIEDVATFRADLGILYLSSYNERALRRRFKARSLAFEPLFSARPHVFVRAGHPLADRSQVGPQDLAPYLLCTFEQGDESSLFLSEEALPTLPHHGVATANDRATMTALLVGTDGFLVSTGVVPREELGSLVAVPLKTSETMRVGYLTHRDRILGPCARDYLGRLRDAVCDR